MNSSQIPLRPSQQTKGPTQKQVDPCRLLVGVLRWYSNFPVPELHLVGSTTDRPAEPTLREQAYSDQKTSPAHDATVRPRATRRRITASIRSEVVKRYEQQSMREIQAAMGLARSSILKILRDADVPRRPSGVRIRRK